MLPTMPTNGMVIPRKLRHINIVSRLDKCGWDGLLGIFDRIFYFSACRQNPSPLLECVFVNCSCHDAGK